MSLFLPNITQPRRFSRKWVIALVILLILGGIASVPVYRHLRTERGNALFREAQALRELQDFPGAVHKALAALQLKPNDPDILRMLARTLTTLRTVEALAYWKNLLATPQATPADSLEYIRSAVILSRFDIAEPLLSEELKKHPIAPEAVQAAALYCFLKGDVHKTIAFSRAALEVRPNDADTQLILAKMLLVPSPETDLTAAKKILLQIISQPSVRGNAIDLLGSLPLSASEIALGLKEISALPDGSVKDFLGADFLLKTDSNRDQLFGALIGKYNDPNNPNYIGMLRWLVQKKEFNRILKIVNRAEAVKTAPVFDVYADAVAGLGEWKTLESLLKEQTILDPVITEVYRARASIELNEPTEAGIHWSRAQALAGTSPEKFQQIALYAKRIDQFDIALSTLQHIKDDPRLGRQTYEEIIRILEIQKNTRGLAGTLAEMAQKYPNDPVPKDDLAYINLLLDENVLESKTFAEKMMKEHPEAISYRITTALGLLRLNQPAEALNLLEGGRIDWMGCLPSWQSIYAAALGATGRTADARQLLQIIDKNRLKPEERMLIAPWL